jgi:hypothetical protein
LEGARDDYKVIRKITLFFFFFLLVLPITFSITTYPQASGASYDYRTGTGFFNDAQDLSEVVSYSAVVNDPSQMPLVEDLDGDGENEIIVRSGQSILLLSPPTLSTVDSLNVIPVAEDSISNMVVADINDDNLKEVMFWINGSQNLIALNYNGTAMTVLANISTATGLYAGGRKGALGCSDTDNTCLLIVGGRVSNTGYTHYFGTDLSYTETFNVSIGNFAHYCLPEIASLPYADSDLDSDGEYHASFIKATSAQRNGIVFQRVRILANITPVIEVNTYHNNVGYGFTTHLSGTGCDYNVHPADQNYYGYVTSPYVADIDGSASNGLEAVVGIQTTDDNFKMFSFNNDGSIKDDFPETLSVSGMVVSNVVKMRAFTESTVDEYDFCVMGYDVVDDIITLLCGSHESSHNGINALSFEIDVPYMPPSVIATAGGSAIVDNDVWYHIAHQAQMSTETTGGNNLDEIVTSYGVFKLINYDHENAGLLCTTVNDCTLEQIWYMPRNASMLPIDNDNVNRHDFLALTETNIWYIDDGWSNTHCDTTECIDTYTINPCLDATWKLNTSVSATLTIQDEDGDDIAGRAILYYGDSNEQDSGWTINASSGTTFSIGGFEANTTIGSGILRLMARDTDDPTDEEIIDLTFSVGIDGVEFGDCTTTVEDRVVTEEEISEAVTDVTQLQANNTVTTIVDSFNQYIGLGRGVVWLIVMVILGAGSLYLMSTMGNLSSMEFMSGLGVIGFLEFLMLLLGFYLGYFGVGWIITIMVVALIIIGLVIGKLFSHGSAGG